MWRAVIAVSLPLYHRNTWERRRLPTSDHHPTSEPWSHRTLLVPVTWENKPEPEHCGSDSTQPDKRPGAEVICDIPSVLAFLFDLSVSFIQVHITLIWKQKHEVDKNQQEAWILTVKETKHYYGQMGYSQIATTLHRYVTHLLLSERLKKKLLCCLFCV